MHKYIVYPALSVLTLISMTMPNLAFAKSRAYNMRLRQEIELAEQKHNTLDADNLIVQELLAEMDFELSDNDPLLSDQNFIDFVTLYEDAKNYEERGDDANLILVSFELVEVGNKIDHPAFQEMFDMTEEDMQVINDLRNYINEHLDDFMENPEYILMEWYAIQMVDAMENYTEYVEANPLEYLSAYPDKYQAYQGQVVWLRVDTSIVDSVETVNIKNLSVEWEQTNGTSVQWLKTDSTTDVAFLTPYVSGDAEYLDFVMYASDGENTTTSPVSVLVSSQSYPNVGDFTLTYAPTNEVQVDPITQLYQDVLLRNPDTSGYNYWTAQYNSGMPLSEIEMHFRGSEEYRLLYS